MTFKRLQKFTMTAVLAAALPGYGFAQEADALNVDGEMIGTPELMAAACKEGEVVYYTAQSDGDERQIVKTFQERFPCISVSVVSAATGRLYERVKTEAQAKQTFGDVLILSDEVLAQNLVDAGLVRDWTPPSAAKYDETFKVEGKWYSGSGQLMYPVYNKNLVKGDDIPKSWKDLANPKFKDKFAFFPISVGGTSWMVYAFLLDHYGEDFLKELNTQSPKMFTTYNTVMLNVARGESEIGVSSSVNEYVVRVKQKAPVVPIYPAEGVPFVKFPMMLLEGGQNPSAAELFGNWYLSKEGQTALVNVRGANSARPDVESAPENPPLSEVKIWGLSNKVLRERYDGVISQVQKIIN
ncbi:ABC transporter substrate-binding protein [Agaricicola taiwanensis]|uniref:ABC transporter substrate-binding protein n=2 Tax=Agaricicola taiwanensis TaxID=591372 RepID=A0A8J2VR41_9RHOB|nr:ABC transporter substrate-binding protein [Agaricicola taiwanensis]